MNNKTIQSAVEEKFVMFDGQLCVRRKGMGEHDYEPVGQEHILEFAHQIAEEGRELVCNEIMSGSIKEYGHDGWFFVISEDELNAIRRALTPLTNDKK